MRISDWSSDVCSSDLSVPTLLVPRPVSPEVRSCAPATVSAATESWLAAVPVMIAPNWRESPRAKLSGGGKACCAKLLSPIGIDAQPLPTQAWSGSISAASSEEHTSEHQSLMRKSYADL